MASDKGCCAWLKKCTKLLSFGTPTAVAVKYLWDAGYKYLAVNCSLICVSSVCWYWLKHSRDRITLGQVVVITGCDSGLGYSLALHCRHLGATVVAGVLNPGSIGANELSKTDVFVYPLDVTSSESVEKFVHFVRTLLQEKNLGLRALVNNAGVMIFGEFEWQTEDQMKHQVDVNVLGTLRITRQMMPTIRAHSSRIILVSSPCSYHPLPGIATYSGTKAATHAWATCIRVELKKYGVDVVCYIPGSFANESNILSQQTKHFQQMEAAMSQEAKDFYGDYFTRYAQYFEPMSREMPLKMLGNSQIYETFDGCLLDTYPSTIYKCEPWRYLYYHALFRILPTRWRDQLVLKFVQLPTWHGNKACTKKETDRELDPTSGFVRDLDEVDTLTSQENNCSGRKSGHYD